MAEARAPAPPEGPRAHVRHAAVYDPGGGGAEAALAPPAPRGGHGACAVARDPGPRGARGVPGGGAETGSARRRPEARRAHVRSQWLCAAGRLRVRLRKSCGRFLPLARREQGATRSCLMESGCPAPLRLEGMGAAHAFWDVKSAPHVAEGGLASGSAGLLPRPPRVSCAASWQVAGNVVAFALRGQKCLRAGKPQTSRRTVPPQSKQKLKSFFTCTEGEV